MFRSRFLLLALLLSPFAAALPAHSHGSHGGGEETLEAGEFDFTPILTIEGHGGFDTNLEGDPKHYAIDGLFGGVFEWGLGNGGSFAIEAAVGPALVWGEAEHFYGKVHVHDDHDDHGGHDDHDDHDGHADHSEHDHHEEHEKRSKKGKRGKRAKHSKHDGHDHHDHDDHDHHDHDHDHASHRRSKAKRSAGPKLKAKHDHHDHDGHDHKEHDRPRRKNKNKAHRNHDHKDHDHKAHEHDDHGHEGHGHETHADGHHDHAAHGHDTDFKRTDVRGFLQARYAPNDRLSFALSWNPYYVTKDQGEDIQGLKNELGGNVTWALGDGDVNFGLGDGLEDLVNGVYLSLDHRQGWESDGMYVGNYTDPRVGLGFKFGNDEISLMIEAGPRFYVPGSYAGLDPRTDFAGEIELSVPVGDATLFLHWQQTYSWDDAPGWGEGWQHHVGTGVTFAF